MKHMCLAVGRDITTARQKTPTQPHSPPACSTKPHTHKRKEYNEDLSKVCIPPPPTVIQYYKMLIFV
jgi:hypothetical protein